MSEPLQAVALMGATGVGKSALALALAERLGTSIVSCDSMQVYRGLDIGTAKPDAVERGRVPHYMIDCADIDETFSAARWAEGAAEAIRCENAAGRRPVITGGTGLYLRALLEGFAEIPPEREAVRERLTAQAASEGTAALHARLHEVDSATAGRLASNDTQRILRALSVYESSGVPLSEWQRRGRATGYRIDCPVFVLELPREVLRKRLAQRFHAMIDAGWLDEVRWLMAQGMDDSHPAMRAVGYRQLIRHLRGECSLKAAVETGITATRRYAKRQGTWFRHQAAGATFGDAATIDSTMTEACTTWV